MELSFNKQELFNNDILKQYDEDGQLGFLGYLLRNKEFIIEDNNIIFSKITSQSKIKKVLGEYNKQCIKEYLKAQKTILDDALVWGITETKDKIDKKIKEIEAKEIKAKEQDRY